jgi:protein involved in plasmid replication-relaxation
MESRLPRFKRASTVASMELTERDRTIIRLVHRHRFLRSSHIVSLTGKSSQQLLRRLQLIFHHGYLERPRAQIDYYHKGGSRQIVYGLGDKGAALLKQEGVLLQQFRWGEKNRSVGRIYLEHALFVSDVMVAIELACRASGIQLLAHDQLPASVEYGEKGQPFRWRVNISGGRKLGIIPDRVFALDYADQDGKRNRAFFFLEADRGTMPVMRNNLSQTSIYRKLLAYEATWSQGIHSTRFGFSRFRVLTVTTSAARVKSIVDACSQLERGHGLFLFTDRTVIEKNIFDVMWQTGRQGETSSMLL